MLNQLTSWLRSLTLRSRVESEMDAELRFHIESYQEDLIRAGATREDALRRARIEFGGVETRKEECRASLGLRIWDELTGDLRYCIRTLRQTPAFTAVAVLSLALGIGANTAIFSLAKEVLLKTMNLPHEDRLRLFWWAQDPPPGDKGKEGHVSGTGEVADLGPMWGNFDRGAFGERTGTPFPYPAYLDMRNQVPAHNDVLEDLAAFKDVNRLSATVDGQAESIDGVLISGNFYHTLGASVIAGRAITERDDAVHAPGAVVISDAYWTRRFGRSADALGKTITLNHIPVTIVGVNSPKFLGPKAGGTAQVFFPMSLEPQLVPMSEGSLLSNPQFWWVLMMGRPKPGVTDAAATTALSAVFKNALRATAPDKKDKDIPRLFLKPGARGLDLQRGTFQKPLYLLLGLAGLVLLIACVNLANLLLARSAARHREMSVRIALGASRFRVMRQVLTESMLLAFAGGAAGLLLGYSGRRIIPNLFENPWTVSPLAMQFDWRVFAFALTVTLITGLLFGLAPAWRSTQTDANVGLKETGRMSASRPKALLGKSLVVLQVSLSMLLLVGAGLFVRTLANLKDTALGLNPERILLFDLEAPRSRFTTEQSIALYQRIEEKLTNLPGVQSAALSSEALLSGTMENGCFRPTGRSPQGQWEDMSWRNLVGSRFFETLGIPIIRGRGFTTHDLQHAPKVGVVNQTLATAFFPGTDPIGKTISDCEAPAGSPPITIVGVSADAKYSGIREDIPRTLFLPYLQVDDVAGITFEIMTAASIASVLQEARDAIHSIDRELPMTEVRTQTQQIDATLSQERAFATLTSGFGILALILASIGIYGIMAYTVSRRTNEIGIRMALGAQARGVLSMILRETTVLVGLGVALGLAAAAALTRLLESMLYGVKAMDPLTFICASALLVAVALVAGFAPARRAASVDPMQALRHE